MKNRILFMTLVLVALVIISSNGCDKKDQTCPYQDWYYIDSSFYISFYLNGEYFKYYQMRQAMHNNFTGYSILNSNEIFRFWYTYKFLDTFDKQLLTEEGIPPHVELKFFKAKHISNPSGTDIFEMDVNQLFSSPLNVTGSDKVYPASQMAKMDGYSLSNPANSLSTELVYQYYEQTFNPDLADQYFIGTELTITSIKMECNDFYIIEGEFNTKLGNIDNYSELNTYSLTNGKFRIIRRFDNINF